jgi:hypothetical protein
MTNYIRLYVKSCKICQTTKLTQRKSPPVTIGHIEAHYPWDLVSIDCWGKVKTSKNGNSYVLTVIDGFTKWAFAIAIPNKEAKTIALALKRMVFKVYGPPRQIHSDKGSEFVNEIVNELNKLYHVKQTTTIPYHPQGNSYAERIHAFYRKAVTAFIKGPRNMDNLLDELVPVYNNCLSEATGLSPAEAFLGRKLLAPGDVEPVENSLHLFTMAWTERLNYILGRAEYHMRKMLTKKILHNARISSNIIPVIFKKDDLVKVFAPKVLEGDSKKLTKPYMGPYCHRCET